ncbi:MAG: Gldg family protein [Planctomycetes bacterium]|nr:Gldg family protein [Planctomycetota bacterium]
MDKKSTALTGTGLSLLTLIGASLVLSLGLRGCRLDMTAEGLYTLSSGTKEIVSSLDETIQLDLYWSESAGADIPQIRTYAQRVREFLQELVQMSGGMLELNILDPEPFSEAEDAATSHRLASLQVDGAGTSLTLGLVGTNSVDETEVIAFFDPSKEAFLEYDVTRMIHTLGATNKPKVGLLSSLAISASFDQQSGQMVPAWQIVTQMQQQFEVEIIQPDATELPSDLQVLMLLHPKALTEEMLNSIDAYAIGGGNILAFLDPHCESDPAARPEGNPYAQQAPPSPVPSDLGPLLSAWGVEWDSTQFIGDRQWAQRVRSGGTLGTTDFIAWLGMTAEGLDADSPITGTLDQLNLATVGSFHSAEGATSKLQPLIQSSDQAAPLATAQMAMLRDPATLLQGFTPTGDTYILAAQLSGTLKSAYSEETGEAGGIFLVADADLLADRNWIMEETMGPISLGWRMIADNGSFALNALETLAGSQALMSLRGRGNAQRPFDLVNEIRQQAEEKYLQREQELQAQIQESQMRINELQREKSGESMMILSPEQEKELASFQDKMVSARTELREVRHGLSKDIEKLGNRLMLWNVAGTPLLVAVLALIWTLRRNTRRRAA